MSEAQGTPNADAATTTQTTGAAASTAAPVEESKPAVTEVAKPVEPQGNAKPVEYSLKKPEGSLLSESAVNRVLAYAKQKNLSNDDAQALLNEQSESVMSFTKAQREQHDQIVDNWPKELEKDPEFGGDNYKKNVEIAHRVVKKFGDEQLIKDLNESGYGNYPPLVKFLNRIGKSMSEDQLVLGMTGSPAPKKTAAEVLYGKGDK